ncbi:MAG: peptidase M61, partial [Bacteroidota bacterium]
LQEDENTWVIPNAAVLDKIVYYVNDTYDIERTETPTPFSPAGTNIETTNFVLNLHGFIGYFEGYYDAAYELALTAPAEMKKTAALPLSRSEYAPDSSSVTDYYRADRYFDVTDNPMFYGDLDVEEFQVGEITIVLSVYSPNGIHSAERIKGTIFDMMQAQKSYLGDMNSTERYDIYLYLAPQGQTAPTGFGALEHHTSTVVVLPEGMPEPQLNQTMIDVVSHEFFHIVTPLSVHSEDVHYFDYHAPTFSKHLWMYEGLTEYFASHFQVYEDLQPVEEFYAKINDKISTSLSLDDAMSFTEMSEQVLDEPYASNYYNVYMKGALIGMCMDILLREQSNGARSMLSVMKELSAKYGQEQPFEDDAIIAELTQMTYPEIGDFLQTHVIGTTPISYNEFFEKVGLELGEEEVSTSFFFDGEVPFIDGNPSDGSLFFRNVEMNSSIKNLGVQPGDIFKKLNGTEVSLATVQQFLPLSFQWVEDTDITITVERDGEELEFSGQVGTPVLVKPKLMEKEDATEEQVQLRTYWLEKE